MKKTPSKVLKRHSLLPLPSARSLLRPCRRLCPLTVCHAMGHSGPHCRFRRLPLPDFRRALTVDQRYEERDLVLVFKQSIRLAVHFRPEELPAVTKKALRKPVRTPPHSGC